MEQERESVRDPTIGYLGITMIVEILRDAGFRNVMHVKKGIKKDIRRYDIAVLTSS